MLIAIINLTKGGVGKSTISINLAAQLVHNGERVKLVDMDEAQKPTYEWSLLSGIECFDNPDIKELSMIVQDKEAITIFDTGGYDVVSTQALLSVCDVVLIPSSMSPIIKQSLIKLMGKIVQIKEILKKDDMNLIIVPNMIDTRLKKNTSDKYFSDLQKIGYKIAPQLSRRVSFENSYKDGGSVVSGSDIKARTELHNLTNFIMGTVK